LIIEFSNNLVKVSEKTKTNIPRIIVWTTFMEPKIKTTKKNGIELSKDKKTDLTIKYSL